MHVQPVLRCILNVLEFSFSLPAEDFLQECSFPVTSVYTVGGLQGQQPGMRTCWMSRKGLEQALWESRVVCWQQPSPPSSGMTSRPVHMRAAGKGQWDLERGMGWVADTHAGVAATRRGSLIPWDHFSKSKPNKQAWDQALRLVTDSILRVSLKKRTECRQIS